MSARIIRISERAKERDETNTNEWELFFETQYKGLTHILSSLKEYNDSILGEQVTEEDFKKHIEGKLNGKLVKERRIEPSYFLCALYVAHLLANTLHHTPQHWYAIDYVAQAGQTLDSNVLQEGGDMCFLLVSLFPERASRRLMNPEYYSEMGASFYKRLYETARKEIGYHMGMHFIPMSNITRSCMQDFV